MRSQRRRNETSALSLDDIHQAISSTINERKPSNVTFEDALQGIETIPRPTTIESVKDLGRALFSAIEGAGEDPQSWKLLVLTIIRRRYHAKAPAAKALKQDTDQSGKGQDVEGHGERLSFYLFYTYLYIMACEGIPSKNFFSQACECLGRLALPAGGTRDLCALLEHLVYNTLDKAEILQTRRDQGDKVALSQAVLTIVPGIDSTPPSKALQELLKVAAKLLDDDLTLITEMDTNLLSATQESESPTKKAKLLDDDLTFITETENPTKKATAARDKSFQSTINTFIPHRERGSKARKLVQSVAELMIWSQTASCKADVKFSAAFQDLCQLSSSTLPPFNDSINGKVIKCVHSLQTSIRRLRKKLNASSRDQGFSLCTSFTMDPASITLGMIKGGKAGDFQRLSTLASKAKDIRMMKLISNVYADPKKAVPISSLSQFHSAWIDVNSEVDEVIKLQLKVQYATVKATINLLRTKIPAQLAGNDRKKIIASIDDTLNSDVAAVLIAAAFDPHCVWDEDKVDPDVTESYVTLKIGKDLCSTSSSLGVMKLLNQAFMKDRVNAVREADETRATTTKDVQNLIERHVEPGSQVILFASTDVKLEARVLEKMQNEKSTIHCHTDDEWSRRMEREKAKVGDITATLAWDNECDLDLHAICPNGDHIWYSSKVGGGTEGGGYLDVDMNQSGESMEPVENIFFGDAEKGIEAAHGKYKIFVQNYAYHGNTVAKGNEVSWRLRLTKDGKHTTFSGACVGTGKNSDVTVVEFDYNGRTAPLPHTAGSALISSNLIGVTSSVGSTIDSLCGLMRLEEQNEVINQVQNLVSQVENADEEKDNSQIEEQVQNPASQTDNQNEETENTQTEEQTCEPMADQKLFNITNRDRLYLNLSRLPGSFHAQVNQSFQGGVTLQDYTASQLAKRLIQDDIHINELRKAGYNDDLINLVKDKMVTFGV